MRSNVEHTISPIYNENSKILILGSMPSPKSRQQGFYYAHPQNRFWPVLSQLFEQQLPQSNEEKTEFLLFNHIALWDVLKSCSIEGADDASIKNAVPNNLNLILNHANIRAVFTTGAKSTSFYRSFWLSKNDLPLIPLPSTSPANRGRYPMERLLEEYRVILDYLT